MFTKKVFWSTFIAASLLLFSCNNNQPEEETNATTSEASEQASTAQGDPNSYDPKRGQGKFDETNVKVGALDAAMATKGEAIANTKCISCHKVSDEKLVGRVGKA